jgi:hypothetical protein
MGTSLRRSGDGIGYSESMGQLRSIVLLIGMSLLCAASAIAQSALGGSPGQSQSSPAAALEAGVDISAARVFLVGTTGDAARDDRIRRDALEAAGVSPGDSVDAAVLIVSLGRIREVDGVSDATYRLETGPDGPALVFDVAVTAPSAPPRVPPVFPVLRQNARSMIKLSLSGGTGVYSDPNAFFMNWEAFNESSPIAPGPPTGRHTTFSDISIEPGIAAIAQVGSGPVYVYGAATVAVSGTWGPDIYQRNDSLYIAVEKGYGGVLWARSKRHVLNVSAGRQNYTLNDGFLIHHVKGSTNVGDRRALFLGARTAHDMTVLAAARYGRGEFRGFFLDPNEYEPIESHTRIAGANARLEAGRGLRIDGSYIRILSSDGRSATPQGARIPREGTSTLAGHLRWSNALGAQGLFLESEAATQWHAGADMRAAAGYASAGYRFTEATWTPALVLRYAHWSGDDPDTARYERWDPLFPAGSDEWMGGVVFSKYVSNSNLRQFRLRAFAQPHPKFNFTVDWFRYRAAQTNNLGANPVLATLSSPDLGHELMILGRTYLGQNYFLQTLASVNWPGRAVKDALPQPSSRWASLQASLYWFF